MKGIKDKIARSYERYCSYDLNVWSLVFYDEKTGGYVVVDLRRIAHSEKSKNEGKKYRDELEMATVFAKNGYRIEMLEEDTRNFKYDVNINGSPADMKRIKATNNIMRAASRAIRKQNSRVVLFQFDKDELRVHLDLIKLKRKGIKVLYFFTGEEKVYKL
ncbi:MAG: hypothetical protein LUD72_09310 [Bacteroidales bacterium]|nr:hypothetical protein [Bacteroidales bacterium]